MTFGVGMKPVSLRIAEILNLLFDHWVDATQRIHVNDRNSPYIPCLLDGLDILFKVKTDFVRERLIRLNVLLPESGICPVDRCENNNLLVREHTFKCADCNIDPTLQSRIVHHRSLRHPPELPRRETHSGSGCFQSLRIPFADWDICHEIVRSHEYDDGIKTISVLTFQLIGLIGHIIPLPAADTIDQRLDSQPFLKITPEMGVTEPRPIVVLFH